MFYFHCNSPNCVGLLILKSFLDLIFSFSFVDLFCSLFGPNTFILLVFTFGQRRSPTPGIYLSLKKKTPFPLYLYISQCLFETHRKNCECCPGHSLINCLVRKDKCLRQFCNAQKTLKSKASVSVSQLPSYCQRHKLSCPGQLNNAMALSTSSTQVKKMS